MTSSERVFPSQSAQPHPDGPQGRAPTCDRHRSQGRWSRIRLGWGSRDSMSPGSPASDKGATHHKLGHGQRPALLAQGHVGEEGAGSPGALLQIVHHGVGVHEDLDFHGLITREGHATRDGDDIPCRGKTVGEGGRQARGQAGQAGQSQCDWGREDTG